MGHSRFILQGGKRTRRLILFIDSGDALVDEGSEYRAAGSEVGECKPSPKMIRRAMEALGLEDGDKKRILMAGNNLKRDILGANRFGIASVLMSWSPRYCMTPEDPEEEPDYTVRTPGELAALLLRLDAEAEALK